MAVTYRITVETGDIPTAGTDANVYLTLYGVDGAGGERLLDTAKNNFEAGSADVFSIEMRDIGNIKRVRIRHDNTGIFPGWFLNRIIVHNEETDEEWIFPCNRWLAHDEDDGEINRVLDPE